jgi:hypothetical protein
MQVDTEPTSQILLLRKTEGLVSAANVQDAGRQHPQIIRRGNGV